MIYAQEGIDFEILSELHQVNLENGNIAYYSDIYNEELVINMEFRGIGASYVNAQGWYRNSSYFFRQLRNRHPEFFSQQNISLIDKGLNPTADETFIKYFPEYTDFLGELLVHHHIGEDGQAVAIPESIHSSGYGEIHRVEMNIGVTDNAKLASLKIQEAFEAGKVNISDVWDKFEFIQKLKTNSELISEFPEWENYNSSDKLYQLKELELSTRDIRKKIETGNGTLDDILQIVSNPDFEVYSFSHGILNNSQLKNKYAFLKVIGDQETLDAYRLADYQSTRSGGGIGITADTPVYLNNKGKRIVIDFDGSYVPDDTTIKTTVSELTEAFNDAEFNKIEDFSELSADEKVKIKRKLTECEGDFGTGNPLYKNLSQLKARDLLELLKNETGLDDLTDVAKNYKGLNSMAKTTKALRGAFGLSIITLSNFESDFFLRKNYFENLEALYIVTKKSIAKL